MDKFCVLLLSFILYLLQQVIPTYTGLHKRVIKFDEFRTTVESMACECCKHKGIERSELERGS